ncbi:MAG: FMN-binding negative transcriptional regulator [Steroidobacteraceae bacterium]|jgi:transcriptional regulator|nr:FMN-binding negative transcriptional regulator [Steroidobacteraceae bacterium]
MYRPPHFREDDPVRLEQFVARHPLACVVAQVEGVLTANHLPLQLVHGDAGERVLRGHVARANELWRLLPAESAVLAVFTGADAYVTPAWYAAKSTTGEVVPTWNYAVVHAHGTVRFEHDPVRLRALVEGLTDQHESRRAAPWQVSDAPGRYVDRMLSGIVGIEIVVTRLEGKFKSSQNRSDDDRRRIEAELAAAGMPHESRAELVRKP